MQLHGGTPAAADLEGVRERLWRDITSAVVHPTSFAADIPKPVQSALRELYCRIARQCAICLFLMSMCA